MNTGGSEEGLVSGLKKKKKIGGPRKTLASPLNYLDLTPSRGEAQAYFNSALRSLAEQVKTFPLESRSKPHNSLAKVRVTAMLRPTRVNQMSLATEVHGNTIKESIWPLDPGQ